MKKNVWLLTLLISSFFLLTGCSKEKDDKVSIEGTWNLKKGIVTYYINGNKDESGENGGTTEYAKGEVTLTLSGGKFTIVSKDEEPPTESGTYTYEGNTLTFNYGEGDKGVVTVTELTQNSLITFGEFTEESEGETRRVVNDLYFIR